VGFPTYRRDSIEELIERTAPPLRPLLAAARRQVLHLVPGATERLRAGWGLLGYDCPRYFAYVVPMPDHVRIGFERGVLLHDPAGLLRGTGTQVRHVELRTRADLGHPALAGLLREAAASRGWVAPAAPRRTRRR
jgi:hypothetical protein